LAAAKRAAVVAAAATAAATEKKAAAKRAAEALPERVLDSSTDDEPESPQGGNGGVPAADVSAGSLVVLYPRRLQARYESNLQRLCRQVCRIYAHASNSPS
jgi:hypothetical protein